jgi:hypothetical protein
MTCSTLKTNCRPINWFARAVVTCNNVLSELYLKADTRALAQQKLHRIAAVVAGTLGALAVLLSIFQLGNLLPGRFPVGLELTAVVVTSLAVFLGIRLSFQSRWQVERNKAERCRLLKFRFLIDPDYWCADAQGRNEGGQRLFAEVTKLESLDTKQLEKWMREEAMPADAAVGAECKVDSETLRYLVAYYRTKRLGTQMRYLAKRFGQYGARHRDTWRIPSWLILGSVVAALLHFVVDLLETRQEGERSLASTVFILLAASLPVFAAGMRTFRSTYEFARNAMRYEAKLMALQRLDQNLETELNVNEVTVRRVFHDLWCCEQIMEFEHREWLRLMIEAEWY